MSNQNLKFSARTKTKTKVKKSNYTKTKTNEIEVTIQIPKKVIKLIGKIILLLRIIM